MLNELIRPASAGAKKGTAVLVLATLLASGAPSRGETVNLTVALAANPQMLTASKLIDAFYAKNPDIIVKFQILPENQLRPTVLKACDVCL